MMRTLLQPHGQYTSQAQYLLWMLALFLIIYFLPVDSFRFSNALLEGVRLTHWYAREHVILCLLPAFVIAGAMSVYIDQGAVMRYLGPHASKPVALSMASVSGALLAVCSCTVLPLFGGIYKRGAGLGAAMAFLYSGPGINIMAVVVTAKVLGFELGIARAVGAIFFALLIGIIMQVLYRKEEADRASSPSRDFTCGDDDRPLGTVAMFFMLMVGILIFANWASADNDMWMMLHSLKWYIVGGLALLFGALLIHRWHWSIKQLVILSGGILLCILLAPSTPELPFAFGVLGIMVLAFLNERDREWADQTWEFTKQIMPLLLVGVFVAGLLLGRPDSEGLIPSEWVNAAVGDNSLRSTFLASLLGAFMYFSTLTEVPIVAGLLGSGMGKGPALALLLAGPALSLPNMLVIRSIIGTQKTVVYCVLVVVMATISGFVYGNLE